MKLAQKANQWWSSTLLKAIGKFKATIPKNWETFQYKNHTFKLSFGIWKFAIIDASLKHEENDIKILVCS